MRSLHESSQKNRDANLPHSTVQGYLAHKKTPPRRQGARPLVARPHSHTLIQPPYTPAKQTATILSNSFFQAPARRHIVAQARHATATAPTWVARSCVAAQICPRTLQRVLRPFPTT